jgi:uncharacterized protein YuzE
MANIKSFRVIYDRDSDVLYITTPDRESVRGLEEEGVVWRYDANGHALGCTVMDFLHYWYPRRNRLAREIAKNLDLSTPQAERILEHAAND